MITNRQNHKPVAREKAALIQANYHTHTRRCLHAGGTDEEYVKEAIRNGYEVLGFSDHCPWKYATDYVPKMRMRLEQFDDYQSSILALKKKYEGRIEILLGLEAEYFPQYMDWLLDFVIEKQVDYLIFGCHYHQSDETGRYFGRIAREGFDTYIQAVMDGLETGMYSYLAHPELPLRSLDWDDGMTEGFTRICRYCAAHDIPLEYNVLGLPLARRTGREGYPHHRFWKIAGDCGCRAIIGMDAHHPKDLRVSLYRAARRTLEEAGVTLVHEIPRVDFKGLRARRTAAAHTPEILHKNKD